MNKKNIFAPLALGLGATRRAAMMLLVMLLTMAQTAWADTPSWVKDGDSWDETTKTLTVNSATVVNVAYQNHSEIENVIVGNDVTSIGVNAFNGCTNLKTVFVGNGVTSIGAGAFYNCANLKTVFVGNGVTSIGDQAFNSCTSLKTVIMTRTSSSPQFGHAPFYTSPNLKIYVPMDNNGNILPAYRQPAWMNYYNNNYLVGSWSSGTCAAAINNGVLTVVGIGALEGYLGPNSRGDITSVVIEEGVTSIGVDAFSECHVLKSVTFAEGSKLESIGVGAFSGCTGLTSIKIPSSVTSIGDDAFIGSNLTSIKIPASVTSIGVEAFSDCNSLGSVTFAEGSQLESIGILAFSGTGLTSVEIPASVTSIGEFVFQDCYNLASMTVADGNTVYDSRNGCNAIIEKSSNTLIAGCKNSTIPASVTSIGNYAFLTTRLTSIDIPSSVTSIGIRAFQNCPNLATVTVYAPSCSLGDNAFLNCNKLENIYVFSDYVEDYQAAWSAYADKITGITGGYCGTTDHERDVVWLLTGESPNYTLTISGEGAMADYASSSDQPWKDYRSSIKTVVIGAGVTSLGKYTFYGCTGLTSIEIPASVTSIGIRAFYDCDVLTSITIPASVTSIGGYAFKSCSNLATVTFAAGSQLTSIGSYGFQECSGLTSIDIPASVTSIGAEAFASCSNLEAIIVDGGNTVYDSRNGCNAIIEKSSNTLIAGCKNTTIPDGVTSIGVFAFYGCTGLTSIDIPAGVTSIGRYAFYGCTGLTSIEIPAGVTSIGIRAFYDCTNLKSIDIPSSVTSIGSYAFSSCSNLATVSFAAGSQLTSIGDYAFANTGLTSIDIPASVTSIGDYAFLTTRLTSIDIPAGVTSIGKSAFNNCSNLETVTVYAPSCTLGNSAFYGCDELANIYVFSDYVEHYQATKNWSAYAGKITAMPTVTTLYVDATGTLHEGVEAIPLNNVMTTLPAGTYVVNSDVAYTGTVTLGGDVHLILADGKTMNVTTTSDEHEDYCINAPSGQSLHIYGQTEGTGALNAQTQGNANGVIYIEDGTLGIHGGNVTATVGGTLGYLLAICVQRTTAGDALVIDRGTLTANGNNGDGIYIEGGDAHINGGQVTATGASAGITVLNFKVDESITIPGILTLSGGILTASGFDTYSDQSCAGTLAVAAGHTYTDGTSLYDSTTETATLAALGGKTLRRAVITSYVDASGTLHENVIAIPLDNTMTTLAAGWYVVNENVDYTDQITLSGDVTLILGDDCTMSFGKEGEELDAIIMECNNHNLTIYGQSGGTGWLKAYSAISSGIKAVYDYKQYSGNVFIRHINAYCIDANNSVALLGGTLDVESGGGGDGDISGRSISILGGKLWARNNGLRGSRGITLGYTNATDQIYVNIYNAGGTGLEIADGKTLVDDSGVIWSGALDYYQIENGINGRTLKPLIYTGVTLTGIGYDAYATFDGSSETTVSIPVDVNVTSVTYERTFTDGRPATVMLPFSLGEEQTLTGGTLYKFTGVTKNETTGMWEATMTETATLQANTPYLLMPNNELVDGKVTFNLNWGTVMLNTTGGGGGLDSDAEGWEFHGTYEKKVWDEAVTHDYGFAAVSGKSVDGQDVEAGQFVRLTTGASAKPMRCYLSYVGVPNQARALTRGAAATDEELPSSIIVRLVGANGEVTGIGTLSVDNGQLTIDNYADADSWYDLQGRKFNSKPTKKGLYINNGKKIVIK